MKLNKLSGKNGARVSGRRIGRGIGSGRGKTSGRGHKGAKSRSGSAIKGFEGGQMPIYRRLPKRGFKNIFRKKYGILNIGRLQQAIDVGKIDAEKPITEEVIVVAGLVRRLRAGVRLLAKGELTSKVELTISGASEAAVMSVEKAGGKVNLTNVSDFSRD